MHELRVEYFEGVGEAGLKVILTAEKERHPFELSDLLFHPGPAPAAPGEKDPPR